MAPLVPPVDLELVLTDPRWSRVNIGLESFSASLVDQGAGAIHVEWQPPAGGDDN